MASENIHPEQPLSTFYYKPGFRQTRPGLGSLDLVVWALSNSAESSDLLPARSRRALKLAPPKARRDLCSVPEFGRITPSFKGVFLNIRFFRCLGIACLFAVMAGSVSAGQNDPSAVERYRIALERMKQMPHYSTKLRSYLSASAPIPATNVGSWSFLGPDNMGGRTRALVIDPTNPNVLYAGAAAGGIWKSTNAGVTWSALGDLLPFLAVNALAMDPTDNTILYAGTGDVANGFDLGSDSVRGGGIYKTTDAGDHWTLLANTVSNPIFYNVNSIVISPNNSQRIYVATGKPTKDDGGTKGISRSTDGGTTWSVTLDNTTASEACQQLVIRTDQTSDYILASCGVANGKIYVNNAADTCAAVNCWQDQTPNGGRIALAIAPSNQNIAYAVASDNNATQPAVWYKGFLAIYKTTDGGDHWTTILANNRSLTNLNNMLLSNPYAALCKGASNKLIHQGLFDITITVDPTNSNRIWIGGVDLFRSDDGGVTWGLASNWTDPQSTHYVRPDQHRIIFHPGYNGTSNKILYVTNDGGIFRTDDALGTTATGSTAPCDPNNVGMTWVNLNDTYAVTQFNHGIVYPDGTTFLGGTQDNGVIRGTDAGSPGAWTHLTYGVGSASAVDPGNTSILYISGPNAAIQKSTDGGTNFAAAINGIAGTGLYLAPLVMDPSNSLRLWTGARDAGGINSVPWRTTDGGVSWTQAGTGGTGDVSAIAVSPLNPAHVVLGRSTGHMDYTTNGLTTTSSVTWPQSDFNWSGYVSSVVFDPTSDNIVYSTFGTFNKLKPKIFKSTDGGAAWTGIDGSGAGKIPDIPVNCILVNPNNPSNLYIGTDLGVFSSLDGGSHWAVENTGFANVPVYSLVYNISAGIASLYAFTHGRGLWRVSLGSVVPPDVSLTAPADLATVTDVITVSADATDDTGVARVDFYVDGTTKIGTDSTATINSYDISWDTKTIANGQHTLTARAIDDDNNITTSDPITVTVDNPITALFQDDFIDNLVAPWTIVKGTWVESGGDLWVTTTSQTTVNGPAGTACGTCQIGTDLTIVTAGGTVWIYGWYKDSGNFVRLEVNDAKNKLTLFQKAAGTTVFKQSVDTPLSANQSYNVVMGYAAGKFQLYLDGNHLITDRVSSQVPSALGKVTYTVKAATVSGTKVATTVRFHDILITP